jgi:hypothetical protein
MSFLRNVIIFLLHINSLSYALQCTTNCSFSLSVNEPFEIPDHCNQMTSAAICESRISIWSSIYLYITLDASTSNTGGGDSYYASVGLSSYGSITYSYSIDHRCNNKDDCGREFAMNKIPSILNRPAIDLEALKNELSPLLSSNLSLAVADLLCFDSNQNVRQCAVVSKPGVCESSDLISKRTKTTRSCNRDSIEIFGAEPYIGMFDMGSYVSFSIKCNRSLCNGPMTSQAVKEILFKYNITKTLDGRLNNGFRLSLSSLFLMLNIIILFLFKY